MDDKPTLVFVYNADSGLFNTVSDIAHKVFSPQTYSCNLCAITHGYFKVQQEWTDFIERLDHPMVFLHRDEFLKQYAMKETPLPAIFQKQGETLTLWIEQSEINTCESMAGLKELILSKLA